MQLRTGLEEHAIATQGTAFAAMNENLHDRDDSRLTMNLKQQHQS
jgi:hypothetical protein